MSMIKNNTMMLMILMVQVTIRTSMKQVSCFRVKRYKMRLWQRTVRQYAIWSTHIMCFITNDGNRLALHKQLRRRRRQQHYHHPSQFRCQLKLSFHLIND